MTRGILWLAVLAALAAALRDSIPADPAVDAAPQVASAQDGKPQSRVTVVRSAVELRLPVASEGSGDPLLAALGPPPLAIKSAYLEDGSASPRELQVLTVAADRREACLDIDRILGRARERDLQETANTTIERGAAVASVHIVPIWDVQDAYGVPTTGELHLDVGIDDQNDFTLFPGAALADYPHPAFWESYRRGLNPHPAPAATTHEAAHEEFRGFNWANHRFYPTDVFDPLGDAPRRMYFEGHEPDAVLSGYLQVVHNVDVMPAPGGLVYVDFAEGQARFAEGLYHPPLIGLARALRYQGLAERTRTRRMALCDDDVGMVVFALAELYSRGAAPAEVADGAGDILRALGHTTSFDADRSNAGVAAMYWSLFGLRELDACLRACAAALSGDNLAAQIRALSRTTLEPDRLSGVFEVGLLHTQPNVRQAAMEGIVTHLPRGMFPGLFVPIPLHCGNSPGPPPQIRLRPMEHWSAAERDAFFAALADRLRHELLHRDVDRAVAVLAEALHVCECGQDPTWAVAVSRLRAAGAAVFHDPDQWDLLKTSGPGLIDVIACELINSSDPAARREGCEVLLRQARTTRFFTTQSAPHPDLEALRGDPYTADLFEKHDEPLQPQPGNGYFF